MPYCQEYQEIPAGEKRICLNYIFKLMHLCVDFHIGPSKEYLIFSCLYLNRNHFNMVLHYFPLKKNLERLVFAQIPYNIHLLLNV